MPTILQDLRYSVRQLSKSPGFTLFAVLVMALGIGANTAVFSVVNAVLLKPLAYPHPDRIVTLSTLWKKTGDHGRVSAADFRDWHDRGSALSALAYYADEDVAVRSGPAAEYAHVATMTPEFFRVFDVQPRAGRLFVTDEQKPGSAGAVVISHSYAESHFSSDADAVGQTVQMFGRTLNIVGVLPAGFRFPGHTEIWFPANTIFLEGKVRAAHNYEVVGRLKDNVSLEQAQAQMAAIGAQLEQQYPSSNQGAGISVMRMRDAMVTDVRLTLYLMLGAVAIVLLIACANMAGLLLAKAISRTREIAIRSALGATRGRILRQMITESLLLSLLAAAGGLLLAVWASRALVLLAPGDVPRLAEAHLDASVLVFTLVVSILASVLFGLVPALQASRLDLNESLKQSAARTTAPSANRLRAAMVIAEIALSVVLLASAGLLLKSFVALHNVALGFRPEHVLAMQTSVPAADLPQAQHAAQFHQNLLTQLAQIPGVSAVGATRTLPGQVNSNGSYWIEYLPDELSINGPQAVFSVVAPGTFATLGIPLDRGRDFNNGDQYDKPFTAVINEALARQAFPGQDPIGHIIFCGFDSLNPMTIVGIAGNMRQYGPGSDPWPEVFMPYQQHPLPSSSMNVVVRSSLDTAALSRAMRDQAHALSPDVPVKFIPLEESVQEGVAAPRFRTLLLSIFAGVAVCLAMAGIYGVMAYLVSQRSSEIGLRMALGASRANVLQLVLRQGLVLTGVGLVLGLVAAVAATRLLASVLFEVKPTDLATYAGVSALVASAALAASYLPARRASKVDPMVALRYE